MAWVGSGVPMRAGREERGSGASGVAEVNEDRQHPMFQLIGYSKW